LSKLCSPSNSTCTPTTQVIGDASPDASKLMKREGVRSVPSFHYFKNGEKVEVVNGANAEAIEAAIKKHA
jgi:thioredoxin 1